MKHLSTFIFFFLGSLLLLQGETHAQNNVWNVGVASPPQAIEGREFSTAPSTEGHKLFRMVRSRTGTAYDYGENITYVIAGFGMLALVIMAFMGKFQWAHLVALVGGLAILAGFQYIVYFLG
ncbi:MAG: hypothetical protein ACTSXQ_07070 [Alphaproteobacteria bacterium]